MSHIYNCHAHVFNLDCAPLKFLDAYRGGATVRGILNWLKDIRGAIPLVVRIMNRFGEGRWPMLQRYAAFLSIGSSVSQVRVFEQQLLPHYPTGTRFVVLSLNMDYMGAGAATLNYESQLWQLLEVRKRHPTTCLPFLCVDPRLGSAAENLTFVKKWLDRGFVGLKLYPSLGFFPFDERLDLIYEFAQEEQLPILTHCARGGIYVQGELPPQLRHPALPPTLLPQLRNSQGQLELCGRTLPLPLSTGSFPNDEFSDLLLEPCLYDLVLARFPELKLCLAHYGGGSEILKELQQPSAPGSAQPPANWCAGIRWLMRKYPNVYTDISFTLAESALFREQPKDKLFATLAADLNSEFYRDRLLFGTDFFMVSRLQPEKTLAGELMQYLLQTPPADPMLWQRLATDNPACFLHSTYYTPAERLEQQQPCRRPFVPTTPPEFGLEPVPAPVSVG